MTADTQPPAPADTPPVPAPIACPRCGAEVRGDQDWCVECGLAARTRMAPIPDWRVPMLVAGAIGLVALVALVIAFVVVTNNNQPVTGAPAPAAPTQAPDTAPAVTPTVAAPAATTPPAATAPAATTPVTTPAVTTPAATATSP